MNLEKIFTDLDSSSKSRSIEKKIQQGEVEKSFLLFWKNFLLSFDIRGIDSYKEMMTPFIYYLELYLHDFFEYTEVLVEQYYQNVEDFVFKRDETFLEFKDLQ
jgi:hypothetical protein